MAQVNWTRQAGLAAALLVLGTTAFWLEYKYKPQKESQEEQSKKLFNLKDVQVQQLTLADGAGHVYEIRCSDTTAKLCKPGDNSKWELAQPLKLKADDANANALVSALNNLSIAETIELKDETPEKRTALLKEYGLDAQSRALPSTKKIEVSTPSGTTTVYLGLNHPIGESIFGLAETSPANQKAAGKADETKVYLVPTYFKANFDHDLTYWRDKKLMTASAHEIDGMKLVSAKANISGERKDGAWTLTTPQGETFPGDIENIDSLLTAATYLTAKRFTSDKKSDPTAWAALKGAKAILTLTLQQEKGVAPAAPAPIVLTIYQKGDPASAKGKTTSHMYATVSNLDPLYELELTARDRLDKNVKDLRLAKLITSMERFTAKQLEFSGKSLGTAPLVLKNKDSKWIIEGEKADPSNEKVQNLLDKLSGNRIQQFLEGKAIPAGEAESMTVKLSDEKGEVKRQVAFWKNGGKLYARDLQSKRKEAFLVDSAIQDELPWTRDAFTRKETPAAAPVTSNMAPSTHTGGAGAPPEPGTPLIPVPPARKTK